jgi:hypothetical protein
MSIEGLEDFECFEAANGVTYSISRRNPKGEPVEGRLCVPCSDPGVLGLVLSICGPWENDQEAHRHLARAALKAMPRLSA